MDAIETAGLARMPSGSRNGANSGMQHQERKTARSEYLRPRGHALDDASLALLALVSQGVLVLGADGRVLSCNDSFATMIGVPAFVLLHFTLDPYLSQRDGCAFRALLLMEATGERHGDFTLRRFDGLPVPVRIAVLPLGGDERGEHCIGASVTDLRRERAWHGKLAAHDEHLSYEAQRRRASEERLGRTLHATGVASWECDLGSGRVVHAAGLDRLLGSSSSRIWSRQAVIDAFLPSDHATIDGALAAAEVTGSIDCEARIERPEAGVRWIRFEGRVVPDAPGTLAVFMSDVTAVHEGQDRLHHAANMEAVGQMAAGIAHDLNNFLHVIGSHLELLGRHVADDGQTARRTRSAQHALLRAAKLSQQLLTFARGQELQLERLSFPRLVTSIRELLDGALPASVHLQIDRADDLWPCTTDLYQLETALLNIAINARDAMPGGGTIAISIANRRVGASAESVSSGEGHYVMFTVCDTGAGMAPDVAARALEPFYTTKALGKGTGLGLSQVDAFAKRSNGFVRIDSELGQGSRVMLCLPRDG